jgi:hypothetical protein
MTERISILGLEGAQPITPTVARPVTEGTAPSDRATMDIDAISPATPAGLVAYNEATLRRVDELATAESPAERFGARGGSSALEAAGLGSTALTDFLAEQFGIDTHQFGPHTPGFRIAAMMVRQTPPGQVGKGISMDYAWMGRHRRDATIMQLTVSGTNDFVRLYADAISAPVSGHADVTRVPGLLNALAFDLRSLRSAAYASYQTSGA